MTTAVFQFSKKVVKCSQPNPQKKEFDMSSDTGKFWFVCGDCRLQILSDSKKPRNCECCGKPMLQAQKEEIETILERGRQSLRCGCKAQFVTIKSGRTTVGSRLRVKLA